MRKKKQKTPVEYSYAEAIALGVGVRFLSMRRIPDADLKYAEAYFMHPVWPGRPGYEEARYEVVGMLFPQDVIMTSG